LAQKNGGPGHYAYPQRDGQAELDGVVWLNIKRAYLRTVIRILTQLDVEQPCWHTQRCYR